MRLLLIEDDRLLLASLEDALGEAGHRIVGITADLREAMGLARSGRPDLALVDLNLGGGASGILIAGELRRLFHVRSLFISGSPDDCRRYGSAIALGCLAKPFNDQALLDALDSAGEAMAGQRPARLPPGLELYGRAA